MSETPPEKVPEKAPKKPVKPPKPTSKRRDLLANLGAPLNGRIEKVVKRKSDVAKQNIGQMLKDPDVVKGLALTPGQKPSVDFAEAAVKTLKRHAERKEKIKQQRKSVLATESEIVQLDAIPKIKEEMDIETGTTAYYKPGGQQWGQMFVEQDKVLSIGPDLKVGGQVLQLLGHYSQLFMRVHKDLEYESMLVNDRIFVAANATSSIKSFAGKSLQALLADAEKLVTSDDHLAERARRIAAVANVLKKAPDRDGASDEELTKLEMFGAEVLAEYQTGHHVDYDSRLPLRSLLTILRKHAEKDVTLIGPVEPADAAKYIDTDTNKHDIILVEPRVAKGWHAEQSLVLALVISGWQGRAAVSGTKNPCFFCFHTLSLVNQCSGCSLDFNITPGLSWTENTLKGVVGVAQELGIVTVDDLLGRFTITNYLTGSDRVQYVTKLTEEMGSIEKVVDLTGKPKRKVLEGRGYTQASSQKSFNFGHYGEMTQTIGDVTGTGPLQEERGDYGTPPTSPTADAEDYEMEVYEGQMKEFEEDNTKYEAYQQKMQEDEKKKEKENQ